MLYPYIVGHKCEMQLCDSSFQLQFNMLLWLRIFTTSPTTAEFGEFFNLNIYCDFWKLLNENVHKKVW